MKQLPHLLVLCGLSAAMAACGQERPGPGMPAPTPNAGDSNNVNNPNSAVGVFDSNSVGGPAQATGYNAPVAAYWKPSPAAQNQYDYVLYIMEGGLSCGLPGGGAVHGGKILAFRFTRTVPPEADNGGPIGPGTYSLGKSADGQVEGSAQQYVLDDDCAMKAAPTAADSGTLSLAQSQVPGMGGTFSVVIKGETLSGSFQGKPADYGSFAPSQPVDAPKPLDFQVAPIASPIVEVGRAGPINLDQVSIIIKDPKMTCIPYPADGEAPKPGIGGTIISIGLETYDQYAFRAGDVGHYFRGNDGASLSAGYIVYDDSCKEIHNAGASPGTLVITQGDQSTTTLKGQVNLLFGDQRLQMSF